jgi:hypothetical protein
MVIFDIWCPFWFLWMRVDLMVENMCEKNYWISYENIGAMFFSQFCDVVWVTIIQDYLTNFGNIQSKKVIKI